MKGLKFLKLSGSQVLGFSNFKVLIMKKLFLLLIVAIMALPVFSQTEYRIKKEYSVDCDNEIIYHYASGNSIVPCCVYENNDMWGVERIDSLFYDENGKVMSRDYYERFEGETEYLNHTEYTYNADGLKTSVEYFSNDSDGLNVVSTHNYFYDDNNRLVRIEFMYDEVVEEKIEFDYNAEGLITEKVVYEDYGWGFTSYEKIKYYYENGNLVKDEYYIYMETDWDWIMYSYNEYEYEGDNCVAETVYYEGAVYQRKEYSHKLDINTETTYTFNDPDNDYLPVPNHVNMITGFSEYVPGYESHELELSCVYDFTYEELGVSVMELSLSSNIYPNPVKDILNVEAENIDLVELYDIYGRKLYSEEESDNVRIDMNNFSSGVYFVKIYSEGKSSVEKIMKK